MCQTGLPHSKQGSDWAIAYKARWAKKSDYKPDRFAVAARTEKDREWKSKVWPALRDSAIKDHSGDT